MKLDTEICYQALLTHDARFDGLFFVGVATTGIYCRTVCTAKTPNRKNCAFYPSAAAAERAGFRPCLRCRPELAPGNARIDTTSQLAAVALNRIEDGALADCSLSDLATEMGVSDRHLRRIIHSEFGVSPIELIRTQRLLLAKRLLTDTNLSVTEVAFASGFSSLSRFNALFKARYRLNPTSLRKIRSTNSLQDVLTFETAYRPPLDWDALLAFLAGHASCGVEAVEGNRYLRTILIGERQGWIAVEPIPEKNALRMEISASLATVLQPTLAQIKRLFDLAAHPQQIAAHLGELAANRPGLRVPGVFDSYEIAVRTIIGQQVSVKAATTLGGRFVQRFGTPVETPYAALTHLSPTPERVARAEPAEIVAIGIISARAHSILALSKAIAEGKITLNHRADVERTMGQLKELPGIGEWTAQYIAMRALGWPDAFPHTDLAIVKALGEKNPKRILQIAEAWRPWRSYATMHLWKSLETK